MPDSIEKETYVQADDRTRHALTYDMIMGLYRKFDEHKLPCENRFKKLENNKRKNTGMSAITGFIGGFAAVLAKWFFEGK